MPNLPVHAASYGSVAVFIDWDNFAIGLREEMPDRPPDLGPVLRWVRQLGPVAVCRAYGEWRDAAERLAVYSAGVEVVYAPVLPLASAPTRANGGKSLADTEMAVDCVDFLHLIPEIATLVIVSSDKDLIPILRFAQRRGLRVYVVGSDRTAGALRDQSDDYVTYRTLLEQEGEAITTPPVRPMEVPPGRFARAPRLTPARSMLATPAVESAERSTTDAGTDTGPSRATLRRRRGRRRRSGSGAAPAASAAPAAPKAASVESPAPAAADSEPDPAMVAPLPDEADAPVPDKPEPPSADAPAAAAAPVAEVSGKPKPESAAAAEESRPALKVLPGESLSRLKGSAPKTPAEDAAPVAAVGGEAVPAPAEKRAEAPAEPAAVEVVVSPAADGTPPGSNGTATEDDTPAAAQAAGTADAPPAEEKKAKTTTRRRSPRRRSSTRGRTSTAKARTAKSAKTAKATPTGKTKAEAPAAAEA